MQGVSRPYSRSLYPHAGGGQDSLKHLPTISILRIHLSSKSHAKFHVPWCFPWPFCRYIDAHRRRGETALEGECKVGGRDEFLPVEVDCLREALGWVRISHDRLEGIDGESTCAEDQQVSSLPSRRFFLPELESSVELTLHGATRSMSTIRQHSQHLRTESHSLVA